jgi:hypothetical protein
MIFNFKTIVFFFSLLILTSCVVDKFDSRLKFINSTENSIFIYNNFFALNDTLINCMDCNSNIKKWNDYPSKESSFIPLHGTLYDEYLMQYPNEILRVFIFSSDTLKKYGWKKASSEYMILKRYDINLEYLQKNNWTIIFPALTRRRVR